MKPTTPTTEQPKHTAIPWQYDGIDSILGQPAFIGGDRLDQKICTVGASGLYRSGVPVQAMAAEARANAQFICTAVNAHQELVEALTNARAFMGERPSDDKDSPYENGVRALIDQMDAALSKLSGGATDAKERH